MIGFARNSFWMMVLKRLYWTSVSLAPSGWPSSIRVAVGNRAIERDGSSFREDESGKADAWSMEERKGVDAASWKW